MLIGDLPVIIADDLSNIMTNVLNITKFVLYDRKLMTQLTFHKHLFQIYLKIINFDEI